MKKIGLFIETWGECITNAGIAALGLICLINGVLKANWISGSLGVVFLWCGYSGVRNGLEIREKVKWCSQHQKDSLTQHYGPVTAWIMIAITALPLWWTWQAVSFFISRR